MLAGIGLGYIAGLAHEALKEKLTPAPTLKHQARLRSIVGELPG